MAQAVSMPKLGQSEEDVTIVKWRKKEGDPVKKGDILFEVETEKAVLEVESFYEGTFLKIFVKEGETAPVNTVVGYIGTPGEKVPDAPSRPAAAPRTAAPVAAAPARAAVPAVRAVGSEPPVAPAPRAVPAPLVPSRLLISPRARKLAEKMVIDPAPVRGSGPGGRIIEADIRAYLAANKYDQLRISPSAKKLAAREKIDILKVRPTGTGRRITTGDVERAMKERPKPMSKMRQVIARRLTESFTSTPHFYVTVGVDMTDLMAYRKKLKDRGDVYSVTDFILKAVILSLEEFPIVNSSTNGTTVRWRGSVDLGMAVSLEDGLVVPVIWNAGALGLRQLHDVSQGLAEKARTGKLLPDEMTGGSFTVSNMGMMNVENFLAIINPGEGGILAVSSTLPTPAVVNGKVKVRAIMKITLSVDHRIIDGATGAAFVNAVKSKLENIALWKSLT